ncbi:hypothetical protein DMN77_03965 [Paenibacillus sp. 79R4]|nr:hypothetical protein [Paenibacillus sp. 79R4]
MGSGCVPRHGALEQSYSSKGPQTKNSDDELGPQASLIPAHTSGIQTSGFMYEEKSSMNRIQAGRGCNGSIQKERIG